MSKNEAKIVGMHPHMCSWIVQVLSIYCCVCRKIKTDPFNKKAFSWNAFLGHHVASYWIWVVHLRVESCYHPSEMEVYLTRYSQKYGKVDKPFSRGQSSNMNVPIIFKCWHFCPTFYQTMCLYYINHAYVDKHVYHSIICKSKVLKII